MMIKLFGLPRIKKKWQDRIKTKSWIKSKNLAAKKLTAWILSSAENYIAKNAL